MITSWHSYPSIFALGHRALVDLLTVPVLVEEKVDGSQFSFGRFHVENTNGEAWNPDELKVRSKGCAMIPDAPEKMFIKAVESVKSRWDLLHPGWTYRCEYLAKPKHNALTYDRVPNGHLIVFDVNTDHETYLSPVEKAVEAARIGLECVPLLFTGRLEKIEEFRAFLDTQSVLGGQKIEGVVVKPLDYNLFGQDKKVVMGKFVSEVFKEVHAREWKASNPHSKDILSMLGDTYTSQARWNKARQHLQESGRLEGSPRDIATLMKEIPEDIKKECEAEIKEKLFAWAWPNIRRMTTQGVPEWYKDQLLRQQFEEAT